MPVTTTVTQQDIDQCNKLTQVITMDQAAEVLISACAGKRLTVSGEAGKLRAAADSGEKASDEKISDETASDEKASDETASDEKASDKKDSGEKASPESVGLILTKEQIKDIKKYIAYGLTLPVTEDDVKKAMGYDSFFDAKKYPEVAPDKFVALNTTIKDHCAQWSDLQASIKLQGNNLESFAEAFEEAGNGVLNVIYQMPFWKRVVMTLEQHGDASKEVYTFNPSDEEYKVGIKELLGLMKEEAASRQKKTAELAARLGAYRQEMDNHIVPATAVMQQTLKAMPLGTEETALKKKIEDLREEVSSLEKQYKSMVGYAFTGAAGLVVAGPFGIISWAVTGGVFGDKAEKLRKTRKKRMRELEDANNKLSNLNQFQSLVNTEITNISKQSLLLADAHIGIQNLDTVWSCVSSYIDSASEMLDKLDNGEKLSTFEVRMKTTVKSWSKVRNMTAELVRLFNEAEAQ